MTYDEFIKACNKEARDNNRTPIQWDDTINAGWNQGAKPWLKINPNYKKINVKNQINDENSILNFYKKLIKLRKNKEYEETFVYGDFKNHLDDNKNVFAYTRESSLNKVLVVVNMKGKEEKISLPFNFKKVLLSNYDVNDVENDYVLKPYEALVIEVEK